MSDPVIEIMDESRKIHKMVADWDVTQTLHKMKIQSGFKKTPLNKNCSIRQDGSDWYALTEVLCAAIIEADGNVTKAYHECADGREKIQRQEEVEALQRQEAQVLALGKIHQLKAKCTSGEWSLDDLQSIFQLVSQIPTTPQAIQEHDELSLAQNDLINDVCKNPSLSEPLKIMYSNAQLGMQQQILNNLANGNSILQQSQKSRNLIGAAGVLGATRALSELGDINDALGGDE